VPTAESTNLAIKTVSVSGAFFDHVSYEAGVGKAHYRVDSEEATWNSGASSEETPNLGYTIRHKEGLNLNKKKVYRLMKIVDLLIKPNLLLRANRTPWRDKPRPERLNEWWGELALRCEIVCIFQKVVLAE
jgi:hypothetical protein